MRSKTTAKFREQFRALPPDIQKRAFRAYRLWKQNPQAHGLYFKRVSDKKPIYSVRIGLDYRALGILRNDTVTWYWIGHHDEYDRLI